MADFLQPRELQHTRLLWPLPSPRLCLDSCPLSWWYYLTISSFAISSYCLPSFPAPESFPVSWLFESGGQSIGASASVSVFPMNNQGWFPLEWTGLISLQSKGPSRIFSDTTGRKHQFFGSQPFFMVQLSHLYITTGKNIASTIWTFMSKVISLLLNMLSWFIIAF